MLTQRARRRRLFGVFVAALTFLFLMLVLPAQGREKPGPVKVDETHLLHRGSLLDGPNGIFFGPDDRLYVAAVFGGEITVLDPRSGRILDRLAADQGVLSPDDVTVGPDGTVYWTNIAAGTVGKLAPGGTVATQFVGFGVNPITLSDDGRLFVGFAFFGDGLAELDPDLVDPPQMLIPPSVPPVGLNGFDFGPDGLLYSPRMFTGEIVRIDVDAAVPVPEVVATGFVFPTAVKFNSNGELHVVAGGDVFRLDLTTGSRTILMDTDGDTDNLAFDSNDRLYVSMLSSGTVLEVLPSGQARLLNPAGVGNPGGLAVLPAPGGGEDVYVADFFQLHRIDGPTGRLIQTNVGAAPMSVNVDATGSRLIVAGLFAGVVQVIEPITGAVVASYPAPAGVNAVPFDGDIAIAQLGPGTVVNTAGAVLMGGPFGPFLPTGMASDGDTLYVADWATGIVWQLEAGGGQTPLAFGLARPEGLELREGELLVVEEGTKSLVSIDLASGARTVLVEGLPVGRDDAVGLFIPPYGMISDVALGPSGSVYITGDDPNSVLVIRDL